MIRSDLTRKLAEQQPQLTAKDVELVVKVIDQHACKGRNPKAGQPINIPGKYLPHFRMGEELRERVGKP
jgi:integration host factor subunit beta